MSNTLYVNNYIDQYLVTRSFKAAPSTFVSEKSKANKLKKRFKNSIISNVCHSDILSLLNKLQPIYANKTINEFLIILRAVFNTAERDGVLLRNPMTGIENYKVDHPVPQPFEKNELAKLFATAMDCEQGKNASDFNVHTGVRISELIAIGWDDVDFQKKELHIRYAKVLKQYKTPKTSGSDRIVELDDRAIEILYRQLELTGKKAARTISILKADNKTKENQSIKFIFYNTKTNQPFQNAAEFNQDFFAPWLKKAGVKHRGVGQLRHTFASQSLTAGISKEWIARQMGHTTTAMIDLHYGKWLKADAPDCTHALKLHLNDIYCNGIVEEKNELPVIPTPSALAIELTSDLSDVLSLLQSKPELVSLMLSLARGV